MVWVRWRDVNPIHFLLRDERNNKAREGQQ